MKKTLVILFEGTGVNSVRDKTFEADAQLRQMQDNSEGLLDIFYCEGCGQTNFDTLYPDLSKTAKAITEQVLKNSSANIGTSINDTRQSKYLGGNIDMNEMISNLHKYNKRVLQSITGADVNIDITSYDAIVLIGFSRGCFTAIFFIKELSKTALGRQLLDKIHLFAFDPVPGNIFSWVPRSIGNKSNILKEIPIRFVLFGIGNYSNKKPGYDRYMPYTSPYTEKDILIYPCNNHNEARNDIISISEQYFKLFGFVSNMNFHDNNSYHGGIYAKHLHRSWKQSKNMICNYPLANSNLSTNPLSLRKNYNASLLSVFKTFSLVEQLKKSSVGSTQDLDKIKESIISMINNYINVYNKDLTSYIVGVFRVLKYGRNEKKISELLKKPIYFELNKYISLL